MFVPRLPATRFRAHARLLGARALDGCTMAAPKTSVQTLETASCVEFCPFRDSSDLLAVGSRSRVTVKACSLQVRYEMLCTH